MNLKILESKTPKKHFIIGTFTKNYIYECMGTIGRKIENITDREVILSLAEDYYLQSRLETVHLEEGLENITTITVINFLYDDFFEDGYSLGMLHISMSPENYFRVTFDPTDFPDKDVVRKIPEQKYAKDYKQLWTTIKSYTEIRDSISKEIKQAWESTR